MHLVLMVLEDLLEEGPFMGDLNGGQWLEPCSGDPGDLREALGQACSALTPWCGTLSAVPPQLVVAEGLGQVTTLIGQPLELPCQASGSPVPTIQCVWGGRGPDWGCGLWAESACFGVGGDGRHPLFPDI